MHNQEIRELFMYEHVLLHQETRVNESTRLHLKYDGHRREESNWSEQTGHLLPWQEDPHGQ